MKKVILGFVCLCCWYESPCQDLVGRTNKVAADALPADVKQRPLSVAPAVSADPRQANMVSVDAISSDPKGKPPSSKVLDSAQAQRHNITK